MQSTKSSSLQSRLWCGAALAALMVAGGAQAATAPAAPAPADAATPSDTDSTNVEQIVITGQRRWPADIEYAVFMIAREALLNALRHARASAICVRLDGDEGQLELEVSDDGLGLGAGAGPGLIGMRERALAIGADLQIDGRAGHGTMVALTWEADEPHLPDR